MPEVGYIVYFRLPSLSFKERKPFSISFLRVSRWQRDPSEPTNPTTARAASADDATDSHRRDAARLLRPSVQPPRPRWLRAPTPAMASGRRRAPRCGGTCSCFRPTRSATPASLLYVRKRSRALLLLLPVDLLVLVVDFARIAPISRLVPLAAGSKFRGFVGRDAPPRACVCGRSAV
jgi:hypothetical protein